MEFLIQKRAAVYKTAKSFVVHPLEQTAPGFWIGGSPRELLPLDVAVADLGGSVLEALRRSGEARDYQPSSRPRDGQLLEAAGYTSRKKFFDTSTFCTVRSDMDDLSLL